VKRERRPHSLCMFELPGVRLKNRSNLSLGTTKAAMFAASREKAKLRGQAYTAASAHIGQAVKARLAAGLTVVITRVAPSAGLDEHDALAASAKQVTDAVADALGLASDRDPRVAWRYAAERGPWGVVVEVVERRECEACGQVVA